MSDTELEEGWDDDEKRASLRVDFESLTAAARDGDEEATVLLYNAMSRYVEGYLRTEWSGVVRNWNSETFRDFTCRVVDCSLKYLRNVQSMRALMRKIADNAMIDHYRRGSTKLEAKTISLDAPQNPENPNSSLHEIKQDEKTDMSKLAMKADESRILADAIANALSSAEQIVMRMWSEGFKAEETAAVLGKSPQAIYNATHRALAKLREYLKGRIDRGGSK